MKSGKRYLPFALVLGVVGVLVLASFPPKWLAQTQEPPPAGQEQTSGPKPDVGETVLVPKKSQPTTTTTTQPQNKPENKPEKINPNDIYTLSTTTSLVNVDVMVVDNNGSPLQNLTKKNFQLFDDGAPQAITNFGTGEAPMTICMLVEFANRWWPFLVMALRYSYAFLEVVHPKD